MAARKALAAQIDQKMLWPRERRWLLDLNANDMAVRKALAAQPDHKMLLVAQKLPVVSRADSFHIARRSHRAPTASVSRAGRIARRQLPYCRSYHSPTASVALPVVLCANSFCSAACFLPSESLVALLSSCARRSQEFGRFRPVPHLWPL